MNRLNEEKLIKSIVASSEDQDIHLDEDKPSKGFSPKEYGSNLQGEELFDALKQMVDDKSMGVINGHIVDLWTASMMYEVAKNLNESNRAKYLSFPIEKMIDIALKLFEQKKDF